MKVAFTLCPLRLVKFFAEPSKIWLATLKLFNFSVKSNKNNHVINTFSSPTSYIYRLHKIDENMKNMPKIIEDFRNKMRVMRSKRREEKKEARVRSQEARRQGIHPKDPRGLQAAKQGDKATKPKKKFQKKKKD